VVKKAGELAGIRLRPHDLRRICATFASRARTPIKIVSKIILRHSSLSTTQLYLVKVSDAEAIRWIENLYDESNHGRGEGIDVITPVTSYSTAIITQVLQILRILPFKNSNLIADTKT
jgi:hypothetical protein